MKNLSIRFRVVALVLLGVAAVTLVVGRTVGKAFDRNLDTMAQQSLRNAGAAFASLQRDDVAKLAATGEGLLMSSAIEAFVARDRDRLQAEMTRIYPSLRTNYGITHLNFIDPAPQKTMFLRMTKPAQFGDVVNRVTLAGAIETGRLTAGMELGKTGFVLRTVRPITRPDGTVAGYLEMGEEIGQFASRLKEQTGLDLGVLLRKEGLNQADWAATRKALGLRDNWNDRPDVVVAQTTTSDEAIIAYQGDLGAIPAEGRVLERTSLDGATLMRGIFPIQDASGKTAGAAFVVQDITALNAAIESARREALLITAALAILLAGAVALVLQRLVFQRLAAMGQSLEQLSLRVAGGDFDLASAAPASPSTDEIGRLESFLGSFLMLIGGTLKMLMPVAEEPAPPAAAAETIRESREPVSIA